MNTLNLPSSTTPPPLPTRPNHPLATSKRKRKIMLTESRAAPYQRATAVIGLFAFVASLLTFDVGWGLNLPLLAAAALGVVFLRKPHMIFHVEVRIQLGIWLALAVAVVFHFDPWTIIPFILVTLVLIGGLLFGRSVDPMRGLARAAVQLAAIPWAYLRASRMSFASFSQKKSKVNSILRLTAFPIFMALGFGTLYVWSNRSLSQWSFNFFDQLLVGAWFVNGLQFAWSLFLSSLLGAGLFYSMKRQDGRLLKTIGINPAKLAESAATWSSVSVALVLVNALALVLNLVDGSTTWIGKTSSSAAVLTQGVHSGTYTLITAIILAASYLLYNFRTAPKDYERARVLAMAWLGQNLMMCFTVALRNYHYTDAYGLTFKRIGVWLFLICTATGLYFLGRKVRENGSIERLVRRQAWAVYLVLATAALPNWPGLITHYNFQEARMVLDEDYLGRLSPYNLAVWSEYNLNALIASKSSEGDIFYKHFSAPNDLRDWGFQQAKLASLTHYLVDFIHVPEDRAEEVILPLNEIETKVDEQPYEVEPSPEEELENRRNN